MGVGVLGGSRAMHLVASERHLTLQCIYIYSDTIKVESNKFVMGVSFNTNLHFLFIFMKSEFNEKTTLFMGSVKVNGLNCLHVLYHRN